jgi:hypothetical protein
MAGNRSVSQLNSAVTLDAGLLIPVVDQTELNLVDQNKKITLAQLDSRFIALSQFSVLFTSELSTKTTDNLAEGGANKYYTEARVSQNLDVQANTLSRHNALSLSNDTIQASLDEPNQILDIKSANTFNGGLISREDWVNFHSKQDKLAPANSVRDGYLSKESFVSFTNKVKKSPFDKDENAILGIQNNRATPVVLADLTFPPSQVFTFAILITVVMKVSSGGHKYRTLWLLGNRTEDAGMLMMSTSQQDNQAFGNLNSFYFFCNPLTGELSYTSPNLNNFISGEIRYRVFTNSVVIS